MTDSAPSHAGSDFRPRRGLGLAGLLRRLSARLSVRRTRAARLNASSMAPAPRLCESGEEIALGSKLFHDCVRNGPGIGQTKNGLRIDCGAFDGSYVSLAVDLPAEQAAKIRVGMNLIVAFRAASSKALPVFLRAHFLNQEGREVLHDLIVIDSGARSVRFNLDGLRIPIDQPTSAWVDVILSDPAGTDVALEDIALEVRPH
ncbi:MAG: DUF6478 family protein [Pseudomonadota bacterium]